MKSVLLVNNLFVCLFLFSQSLSLEIDELNR